MVLFHFIMVQKPSNVKLCFLNRVRPKQGSTRFCSAKLVSRVLYSPNPRGPPRKYFRHTPSSAH